MNVLKEVFKRVHEALEGALIRFAQAYLYFGAHTYRMKFMGKPQSEIPTMAIDRYWRVFYSDEWVEKCNPKQNVFNIYHELEHPLLGFWDRLGDREYKLWNYAHDLEINSGLMMEIKNWQPGPRNVECPMELPPGVLTPEQFGFPHGLLAEEYYELLKQKQEKERGRNGGGKDGNGDPYDFPNNPCNPVKPGEEDPEPGGRISPAEGEIMKRKIAEDLQEHKKSRGYLPSNLEFFVQRTLHPVVNWKRELRAQTRHALITTQGKNDYTYRKRSRRDIPGVVMPGLQDHMPVACVGQDTSGSMSEHEMDRGMTELAAILNLYRGRFFVHFLALDAVIQKHIKLFHAAQPVALGGRGGTNMIRFFESAMELKPKPDCLVLVTDGETPWPDKAPDAKTIIICTTDAPCPSWAKVIRVGAGEKK